MKGWDSVYISAYYIIYNLSAYYTTIIRSSVFFSLLVLNIQSFGFYFFGHLVSVFCTCLMFDNFSLWKSAIVWIWDLNLNFGERKKLRNNLKFECTLLLGNHYNFYNKIISFRARLVCNLFEDLWNNPWISRVKTEDIQGVC